jgi:hypothetical protein
MPEVINLSPIPSQSFKVVLSGQDCEVSLYLRGEHFFLDLVVDGQTVQTGAIVNEGASIISAPNAIFSGSLAIVDMLGDEEPQYAELGTRWVMAYYPANEPQPQTGVIGA